MNFRIVHDKNNKIKKLEYVLGDEFNLIFKCYDEYGEEHGINHDSARMLISYAPNTDLLVEKAATIQGNRMTFAFIETDFDFHGRYIYQVEITEDSMTYTIASGELNILPKIQ